MRLREWTAEGAAWYAEATRDPEVQRFTADPPTITAQEVASAIEARSAVVMYNWTVSSPVLSHASQRIGPTAVQVAQRQAVSQQPALLCERNLW